MFPSLVFLLILVCPLYNLFSIVFPRHSTSGGSGSGGGGGAPSGGGSSLYITAISTHELPESVLKIDENAIRSLARMITSPSGMWKDDGWKSIMKKRA